MLVMFVSFKNTRYKLWKVYDSLVIVTDLYHIGVSVGSNIESGNLQYSVGYRFPDSI